MNTRSFIETSGIGSRWEFDKKTLFGLVDHITRISRDVANIAKVSHIVALTLCARVQYSLNIYHCSILFKINLFNILLSPSFPRVCVPHCVCITAGIL